MDELTRERYPNPRPPNPSHQARVIAERRRVLCGTDGRAEEAAAWRTVRLGAMRRKRDQRLARAIGRWSA